MRFHNVDEDVDDARPRPAAGRLTFNHSIASHSRSTMRPLASETSLSLHALLGLSIKAPPPQQHQEHQPRVESMEVLESFLKASKFSALNSGYWSNA